MVRSAEQQSLRPKRYKRVSKRGERKRAIVPRSDLKPDCSLQTSLPSSSSYWEGYSVMVLNPNENYLEVEKPSKSSPLPSPTEPSDEPAEKRERKDDKEGKKKREFYEKYRNPQKETETERTPIRITHHWAMFMGMLMEEGEKERAQRVGWKDRKSDRRDAVEDSGGGWVEKWTKLETEEREEEQVASAERKKENGSSEEHVLYVWDHFVSKAAAKNVFIVAHSYGGLSFVELVSVSVFRLSVLPPTDTKTQ
eukprot:superscaffoldBa00001489_g10785